MELTEKNTNSANCLREFCFVQMVDSLKWYHENEIIVNLKEVLSSSTPEEIRILWRKYHIHFQYSEEKKSLQSIY